jgi:exodeoxyribonuclease III
MRITTWNVNSIRARLDRVLEWQDQHAPDVLCLQEIKCQDHQFPAEVFEELGWYVETYGQKTYNGVAILSREPAQDVQRDLPWAGDAQARGIAATVRGVRVVNLYVVNGSAVGTDKFAYKLEWLRRLQAWLAACCDPTRPLVVCGDFNIAPDDRDCYDPAGWHEQVLCTSEERAAFRGLLGWGLHDAFRHLSADAGRYTWWDFRTRGFERGEGLRIDHHLVSAPLLPRVQAVEIDTVERGEDKPSDHAPVTLVLAD